MRSGRFVPARRANELTLAGLRPGHDTVAEALKRYKTKYLTDAGSRDIKQWLDACTGRSLTVEADLDGLIQEITVSALADREDNCDPQAAEEIGVKDWGSSHGIRLGDPRSLVIRFYGQPDSSGPSVRGSQDLEFLYYSFDWAGRWRAAGDGGSTASGTGKIVEITLAFPSL